MPKPCFRTWAFDANPVLLRPVQTQHEDSPKRYKDSEKIKNLMRLFIEGKPLSTQYKQHPTQGKRRKFWEANIQSKLERSEYSDVASRKLLRLPSGHFKCRAAACPCEHIRSVLGNGSGVRTFTASRTYSGANWARHSGQMTPDATLLHI